MEDENQRENAWCQIQNNLMYMKDRCSFSFQFGCMKLTHTVELSISYCPCYVSQYSGSKQPSPSPAQYSCVAVKAEGNWSLEEIRLSMELRVLIRISEMIELITIYRLNPFITIYCSRYRNTLFLFSDLLKSTLILGRNIHNVTIYSIHVYIVYMVFHICFYIGELGLWVVIKKKHKLQMFS